MSPNLMYKIRNNIDIIRYVSKLLTFYKINKFYFYAPTARNIC